ncbi:MAG: 16S rRNA (guanine(966)-N(2))-methyltransferase RsmD [Methylomonas sp.]
MINKIRIIGGEWRSRLIGFDDTPGLRPTPDRVRETLFNWLQSDVAGSTCLDLFSGSGALGFEAASRGAKRVVQVENNPIACQKLLNNKTILSAVQVDLIAQDVNRFLQTVPECFDLVFLDPPFGQNLISSTCQQLEQRGWLADYAKIYVEAERQLNMPEMPANWKMLKNKLAGQVKFCLFQRLATPVG